MYVDIQQRFVVVSVTVTVTIKVIVTVTVRGTIKAIVTVTVTIKAIVTVTVTIKAIVTRMVTIMHAACPSQKPRLPSVKAQSQSRSVVTVSVPFPKATSAFPASYGTNPILIFRDITIIDDATDYNTKNLIALTVFLALCDKNSQFSFSRPFRG